MKNRLFSVLFGIFALLMLLPHAPCAAARNPTPQQQTSLLANPGAAVSVISQPKQKKRNSEPAVAEDREERIRTTDRLKRMGENVDWQKYDLLALLDMESRVESARHLQELGVRVDWRKCDIATLSDMEMRVEAAQQLEHQGVKVDWRKHDLLSLFDLQTLVETAQRLRQKGITIELRKDGVLIPVSKHSEDRV